MESIERLKSDLKTYWNEQHYFNIPGMQIYTGLDDIDEKFCNCFHYTSMSTFWNIVQSDLMYATHVRFSNDNEEYKLGQSIIEEVLSHKTKETQDVYMICFCTKRDLLSQWRDYGRGGVCLGMDLTGEEFYTIQNNNLARGLNEKDNSNKYKIPSHGAIEEKEHVYQYAKALKVYYIGKNHSGIEKKYKKINKMLTSSEIPKDKYMRTMIPYIKHSGFKEEKEARLIFQVSPDDSIYQINYMESSSIKKPYIKVEFGEIAEKQQSVRCIIHADHIEEFIDDFNDCVEWIENDCNVIIEKNIVNKHSNGQIIIGCVDKQQEIFERLDVAVSEWNYKHPDKIIKIWCKGHIPIREIMVGPCQNREDIKEAIMHYVSNVFWLKYVNVKCTKIPYRDNKNLLGE